MIKYTLLLASMFLFQASYAQHLECKPETIVDQFLRDVFVNKTIADTIREKHTSFGEYYSIIHLSEENPEKIAALNDEYAQLIFQAIRKDLKACTEQNKEYEILDLEQAIEQKRYDGNIQIPESGHVYLLYCENNMITHLLIRDDKIIAFSTINKGGRKIFMIL